jgi:homocitrate synthase NifV
VGEMICITDNTLACLDAYEATPKELHELLELLLTLPIRSIEMSIQAYEKLISLAPLPEFENYLLKINNLCELKKYQGFAGYLFPASSFGNVGNATYEINFKNDQDIGYNEECIQGLRMIGFADRICTDVASEFKHILSTKMKFEICPQNDFFCATALAVEWCRLGGKKLVASFTGIGNQASLEEVLLALHLEKQQELTENISCFGRMKQVFEQITGKKIAKNKAIIGEEIFCVEAGIHVDGIVKNPKIYEPYPPELVGSKRRVIMGKHSGKSAILAKLSELQIAKASVDVEKLLLAVKQKSVEKQQSLTDEEFIELIKVV